MKIFRIIFVLLICTGLAGCSFGASIDTLMSPPRLSVEQENIYNALTDATGTSISLKYPKSGKYLSAFIVEDIDGDGGNEAVVFYDKTGLAIEENTLRMNILDKEGDRWRSVCDTPTDGTEIEKVMISKLGNNERINLIVGSSLINRSEKNVSIYNYDSGVIEKTFNAPYSFIDITDLDDDEENEFVLLSGAGANTPATAETYKLDSDGKYYKYVAELSGSFTEFDSVSYGVLTDGQKALYIDAGAGSGMLQTDIVYMDDTGLKKVFGTQEDSLATVRPSGCSSYDIDGDGGLEIPVQVIATGYEDVPESEQMKFTNWLYVSESGKLEKKYTSYYSISNGYIFIFPEKWQNRVTVKRDAVNDEIVFCALTEEGTAGDELVRVYVAEDTASREDRISAGYMLFHTKGDSAYLVSSAPERIAGSDFWLSSGVIASGFRFKV